MTGKPSDRMSPDLAWDTLSVEHWYTLVSEMIHRNDLEAVPKVLALMAIHGHPDEAHDLLRAVQLASKDDR